MGTSDAEMLERIVARRAELELLEEQLVKQLAEVRGEQDELRLAERVVQRISEQGLLGRAVRVLAGPGNASRLIG